MGRVGLLYGGLAATGSQRRPELTQNSSGCVQVCSCESTGVSGVRERLVGLEVGVESNLGEGVLERSPDELRKMSIIKCKDSMNAMGVYEDNEAFFRYKGTIMGP